MHNQVFKRFIAKCCFVFYELVEKHIWNSFPDSHGQLKSLGTAGGIHRVDATSTSIFAILTPSTGGSRWIWKLFESILHRLKYRGGGFLVCGFKILIRFFDRKFLLLVFKSEFGWTSAQQLKNADSISKITKKTTKIGHIFSKIPPRRQNFWNLHLSRWIWGGWHSSEFHRTSTFHLEIHPTAVHFFDPPRL